MNYIPLYVKSDYSILSSLIKIDSLINYLKENNITSCGVCDDNLFYVMEFYTKCIKNNIKPIIGLEVKIEDYFILLYAKNYKGYQNLCFIDSLKNEDKLTSDILTSNLNDIIVVLPYEFIDKKNLFDNKMLYIGYDSFCDVKENKVYLKKINMFKKEDDKYLSYLYKIKDEEKDENNNSYFEDKISDIDSKSTIDFSNLIDIKIEKNNDLLPKYSNNLDFDCYEYLTNLCLFGIKKRLDNKVTTKYLDRLKYELNIINEMGFCNYFLIVWDYVKYAKKNNILVGPGRGSAASSLVSFCLGITDIDPIKYDLLFERFLNPKRVTMPDIDIDFDADKRDKVIEYVTNKYGKEKVSGIITFSNLQAKQVIRDLSKIFNISNYKIDSFLSNFDDKKSLKEQLNNSFVKKDLENDTELQKLFDAAIHLEGLKRHTSSHAAGIIISNYNLNRYVPLSINTDSSYLCGYTGEYIEDLGLLKMDFLGLKNLSIIDNTVSNIKDLDFKNIPLDDKKTYDLFNKGLLEGIFQFESNGMKKFILDLKPNNINDLIAAVALFRPGPIDNIALFIKRKQGKEKIDYIESDLEDILKSTYGVIIYQEQIMQIATKMASFSLAEADNLRRAMSKKKEELLISYKEKFISGSIKNGYDEQKAEEVYNLILKFANYGFNKAHSVSYAILGYKIAYLKANYPLYFMCSILNNYIGSQSKTKNLINECKMLKIDVIKPNINDIDVYYKVIDNKIVYPLSMIKGIGTLTARQIIEEKNNNGEYKDYIDFVKRTYKCGKDVIRSIILSGCLDIFGYSRKTLIENLEDIIDYADLSKDLDTISPPVINEYEEYSIDELSKRELELFGFYINNHPTCKYIIENSITTKNINNYFDKNIDIILYFERKKEITTKKNEKMMFISASDMFGFIDLVLFPKSYEKYFNIVVPGIYKVNGKVEKRFSDIQIIINEIKLLK